MKKCRDREWKIEKKNGGKMRGGGMENNDVYSGH